MSFLQKIFAKNQPEAEVETAAVAPSAPLLSLSLADRIVRRPEVVSGEVTDEAILVSPEQARVRMLNEVGSQIWNRADGSRSLQEMADEVAGEYDVTPEQAAADVLAFAGELLAAGVVEIAADA